MRGLLRGEEFVPKRIELLQTRARIGFGDVVGVDAGRLPYARHDLGLTEHGARLINDRGLDLACGKPRPIAKGETATTWREVTIGTETFRVLTMVDLR